MGITPIWFRRFIAARHVAIPGWHSAAKPLLNGPGSRAGGRYREKGSPSWRGRGVSYRAFGPDARIASAIAAMPRSEEHTSELQSLMRNSYAGFCLKKKKQKTQ